MSTKARFKILPFPNPSGKEVFRVSGCKKDGKQIRENFPDMRAATIRQQELEAEFHGLEISARLTQTRLTPSQIADAELVYNRLGDIPLSVVADFYFKNFKESAVKILLSDAFTNYVAGKKQANKRPDTIRDINGKIGQLVRAFPTKMVHEVLRENIVEVMNRPGKGAITRGNDRRLYFGFFKWCVSQGYCAANPVETIDTVAKEKGEVEILALEKVRALMQAATDFKDGRLVPFFTLALFCAIRPTEVSRLKWDNINLKNKTVTIGAAIAKKRGRRIVEIPENAIEFLLPHALKKTPIHGTNFRKDFDAVKAMAGFGTKTPKKPHLKPWTQDICRHTGISYHFATHEHEGKTAKWAGNSPDVVQSDYKGLVEPTEAKEFWQIKPGAKILQMKAA